MQLKGKEFVEHQTGLFVSRDGEVFMDIKSRKFPNGNFTYGYTNVHGYRIVGYKGKLYRVHRLVGECYLPNPNNYPTIDHINRVKDDNRVENLRWASYSLQNINKNHQKYDAKSKLVIQYTPEGELVREWPSTNECHRNGFNKGAISACCNGKRNNYKRFIWKYKEEELEQI